MPFSMRYYRSRSGHVERGSLGWRGILFTSFILAGPILSVAVADPPPIQWKLTRPLLSQGEPGGFDETAIKDPSIVFYDGFWHLFYTARGQGEYTTGYTRAKTLGDLGQAKRYRLPTVRGASRYGCAPQIFYFAPQETWYLIFQNRNSNYQPAYVTNPDIFNPAGWSEAKNLLDKDTNRRWIDFWIICDAQHAYLFYTEAHRAVMFRRTSLADFPSGWGPAREAFIGVHEAVHIYKVAGRPQYDMIFERNTTEGRSFGLARSDTLEGPWNKVTDAYATGAQLAYSGPGEPWSEMVSHGEALRRGYDQQLEYDPADRRWLIQGLRHADATAPYPTLRWQLGIIERTDPPLPD